RHRAKERLDAAFLKFTTHFDRAVGLLTAFNPPALIKLQGNRMIYALAEVEYDKGKFSKVSEAMSAYIDSAELFIVSLSNHFDNLTTKEQAIVSEWQYWIREMKIKAGEWIEIFLDDNADDFSVWM